MSGGIIEHETTRVSTWLPDLAKMANDAEVSEEIRELGAPIDVNPKVNLFAIYEKRRKDFMATQSQPEEVVKYLQVQYWSGLEAKKLRTLHSWAKEDYNRTFGIKPEVPVLVTESDENELIQEDDE